jgi:hypothetical protein
VPIKISAKPTTKTMARKGNRRILIALDGFMVFSPMVLLLLCKFDIQADSIL